jgi:hypothetical protein
MANYYMKNAADGGSDNQSGQDWANAWATPEKAMASCIAGDVVFAASDLNAYVGGTADRYIGDYTNAAAGTEALPVVFVSVVKDCAMPPALGSYQKGALLRSDVTTRTVYLCGNSVWHGWEIRHPKFALNNRDSGDPYYSRRDRVLFIDCTLSVGYEAGWNFRRMKLWDCLLRYTYGSSFGENIMRFDGTVIRGGSLDWQYAAASSSLIHYDSLLFDIYGFDFTGLASTSGILGAKDSELTGTWVCGTQPLPCRGMSLRGCKLHTGGVLMKDMDKWLIYGKGWHRQRAYSFEDIATSGLPAVNSQWMRASNGVIEQSTAVKLWARAVSDKYSWKLTTVAKGPFAYWSALSSPILSTWTSATTQKTYTIEILHDSATALKDDEVWLELRYSDNSGPKGLVALDRRAYTGSPANQDAGIGASAWTHNLSNPNSQKLSVTVTPVAGQILEAVVYLAKASKTIYIDPVLRET